MAEVSNIIKKIAAEGQKINTYPAKVIRVNTEGGKALHPLDSDAYTVDVMRADGAEISHVRLKASIQDKEQGFVCVPKIDSWVLVSIIETTETRAFISQYSEIEKIFLRIRGERIENGKRVKADDFFQLQSDSSATTLLYKSIDVQGNPETNTAPTYKDISKISYGGDVADKSLNVQFFNENIPVVEATIDKTQVDFKFSDDAGEALQQTTMSGTEVKTVFTDGYQTLVEKDKVLYSKGKLKFEMSGEQGGEDKFLIAAGGQNLLTQLHSLIDEITKIVVVQGTNPNVGALMRIRGNIDSILK